MAKTSIKQVAVNKPANYASQYQNQINQALAGVTDFSYDPMQDASYKALARVYQANGDKAARSTMADAAAMNGGLGTSYSVTAAQQARNDYNQQLASYIPELEEKAYNRNLQSLNAYRDADNTSYSRFRDQVADYQWGQDYNLNVYQAKKSRSSGGGRGSGGSGGGSYGSSAQNNVDKLINEAKNGGGTTGGNDLSSTSTTWLDQWRQRNKK